MMYKDGVINENNEFEKEYDACHYIIKSSQKLPKNEEKSETSTIILNLKINAMENMNVYIFGGESRDNATIPIVQENEMAK